MIDLTIGADHRGMELKDQVSKWLCPIDECMGDIVTFHDVGIYENKRTDYNDIAKKACRFLDKDDRVILFCGSGFGMAIQANRFRKVRAVVCKNVSDVKQARQHNDMNVLCIGADDTNFDTAKAMCKAFFTTKFLKGRHTRRVKKLYENRATN